MLWNTWGILMFYSAGVQLVMVLVMTIVETKNE